MRRLWSAPSSPAAVQRLATAQEIVRCDVAADLTRAHRGVEQHLESRLEARAEVLRQGVERRVPGVQGRREPALGGDEAHVPEEPLHPRWRPGTRSRRARTIPSICKRSATWRRRRQPARRRRRLRDKPESKASELPHRHGSVDGGHTEVAESASSGPPRRSQAARARVSRVGRSRLSARSTRSTAPLSSSWTSVATSR